ncbi:pilus assembly protein PilM [Bacillus carboniphilus]|uniref:Pilus assembly protein PilM n=1 Tax=Bacillus carboniphilus TaxID=86663 RepID=A0ABY9JY17_9BACI|nr:cell division FtsA domain-containing protein [Bacillus carboniphilus]WLR44301.1 pilus assembly protein PilM [Bacillus carboniphilus]
MGTRTVIGLLLSKSNDHYHVEDIVIEEHEERAMLDGQIHNVISVAEVISKVKNKLEKKHGPLKKACIAAAGRSLKTVNASSEISIQGKPFVTKEDIIHLELSAVQEAQIQLSVSEDANSSNQYDCVGYSVLHYKLDNHEIGHLIDQQGKNASVDVIATFLPKVVVESLLSALKRADLEMRSLTLEPIAAINVLTRPNMRHLNIALVDIGAGTSDIAITNEGTVVSYGMVPIAGDEITEVISEEYLLDFSIAEKAKRELLKKDEVVVTDILGVETKITQKEMIDIIRPATKNLANQLKEHILMLNNGQIPKAIMLVGGGSLTPEIDLHLSQEFDLPHNRIAIRGVEAIQKLTIKEELTFGPEIITPIGIAISSTTNPIQYIYVKVNETPMRLFQIKPLTVGDVLLSAGVIINDLYGKPARIKTVTVNGKTTHIPGEKGDNPFILKNGHTTSLKELISSGDHIEYEKGADGKESKIKVKELVHLKEKKSFVFNDQTHLIETSIKVNGKKVDYHYVIDDNDVIISYTPSSIRQVLLSLGKEQLIKNIKPFIVLLNGKPIECKDFGAQLYHNGVIANLDSNMKDGDVLTFETFKKPALSAWLKAIGIESHKKVPIIFNDKKIILKKPILLFYKQNQLIKESDSLFNGDSIVMKKLAPSSFIFQDLFKQIDLDIPKDGRKNFKLTKNGKETTFDEKINENDRLKIEWF